MSAKSRSRRPQRLFVCTWRVYRGGLVEAGEFTVLDAHVLGAEQAAKKTVRAHAGGDRFEIAVRPASIGERIIERLTPGEHVSLATAPDRLAVGFDQPETFRCQIGIGTKQDRQP